MITLTWCRDGEEGHWLAIDTEVEISAIDADIYEAVRKLEKLNGKQL